jgi:hypothetical protein
MTVRSQIQLRVNDELLLDAGTRDEVTGSNGPELLIRSPEPTLYRQVLAYLRAKPDPTVSLPGSRMGREGVAAAALSLRWGSYLAVLRDANEPNGSDGHVPGVSRISDGEMARINIEASSALAEWIELCRADPASYRQLVERAVFYLPMPKRTAKPVASELGALADPEMAELFVRAVKSAATNPARFERARVNAERYPTRVFANAMVNVAWRNGPVEDIHAGEFRGYPLNQQRVSSTEARKLLSVASGKLAFGMDVCQRLTMERPLRPWLEQVLPYGLAETWLITPRDWSLIETSREVPLLEPALKSGAGRG